MAPAVRVSFCATNLNTADRLGASLDAIDVIGRGLGVPYEVVVADGPSHDGARELLEDRARQRPDFRLVRHAERRRGTGRRLAFEASSGSVIVPFDTSISYVPAYGGLLHAYLQLRTDRMLFSEICALSRHSIEEVGGWRDLIGAEDIDVYGPLIERFGVIAWPVAMKESQSARMGAYARQMRYVQGSSVRRLIRMYTTQRDQFIGADYRVRDLMALNAAKPPARRAVLRVWFTLAAIGARFRPIRPRKSVRNHYLILREAILESLLREDYKTLVWDGPSPQLLLTPDEIGYLAHASRLWPQVERHTPPLYGLK
jgi:glycosyltransferase involved in cell wall biosynthesis